MAKKRSVVFLYRRAQEFRGSKLMRCDQLKEIAEMHLGERYSFHVRRLPAPRNEAMQLKMARDLEGCILVLLKSAALALLPGPLHEFRRRAAGICLDYVDASLSIMPDVPIDVHVSASIAGKRALETELARKSVSNPADKVHLVHHHADPRIAWSDRSGSATLSACYVGEVANTFIPAGIRAEVEVVDTGQEGFADSAITSLQSSNFHYGIRPEQRAKDSISFKPFTKGFNAAAAGANILVRRTEGDAVAILGDDYPFFCDAMTEQDIVDEFRHAQSLVGGAVWNHGLELMKQAREVSKPAAVARDLASLLERFD
jgi:hypothetical protein